MQAHVPELERDLEREPEPSPTVTDGERDPTPLPAPERVERPSHWQRARYAHDQRQADLLAKEVGASLNAGPRGDTLTRGARAAGWGRR